MGQHLFFRTIVLSCSLGCCASGLASDQGLKGLNPSELKHPYLHFRESDLPEIRKRVATDPRARIVYERLLAESNRLLEKPVSRQAPPRGAPISPYFVRTGDAQDLYRKELGRNAMDLAFVYQLTGDLRYARKSYEFAEALSVLDSWVDNWDKFEWLYLMGKPYGSNWSEEEYNEIVYSYDLGAAHASVQLAATYDWLYPALDDFQRKRIRNALLENAVLRVRGNYDYHWWAHSWRTNWLPVCFSGIGLAALAMIAEDPQLVDVVEEAKKRMERFLAEAVDAEGGFQEGVGYWRYGMENVVLFASVLKQATGGRENMFDNPRLKRTVQFPMYTFVAPSGSVPFGDSRASLQADEAVFSHGNYALYTKLAGELNSPEAKWLGELFRDFDADRRPGDFDLYSIIWPEAAVVPSLPDASRPLSMHFPGIDWVILRSSWTDTEQPLMAAKGGIHDDPHHGHLDSGQIAIAYRGEWHVRELGYMRPYGLGYWDHLRRYRDYIHANSLGHNVIFVNGEQQKYGPQHFGKVSHYETSDSHDFTVIDASKAYPGSELKEWKRHILYSKPRYFVVVDEVGSEPSAEIAMRIHPGLRHTTATDHALLIGERGQFLQVPLLPQEFTFKEGWHSVMAEVEDAPFEIIHYYDLVTEAETERTFLVNLFLPVEDEAEARQILQDSRAELQGGTLLVSTVYRGRQDTWEFNLTGQPAVRKR